tara:strand:- start:160 stop:768 length:609 start_codon:yes stop_codon:yes gene_type:complete
MSIVKLNNRGVRSATTFGSISGLGEMRFISKQTASSSSTISFTSGIDSTYKEYLFTFNNIHPSVDGEKCGFQANASGGSGYNETMTTTFFHAAHNESDSDAGPLEYEAGYDLAQGTTFQRITRNTGNDNDQCWGGYLHLFNPSSTTFVKHFIAVTQSIQGNEYSDNSFIAGYFNTTSAIDEIQFKMESGNIDAGDICLYGIN